MPGANDEAIDLNSSVFSLGSNTAIAVAPILKALDSKVGVERAFLTTVHGYSNSNRLADVAGEGFRLNRAAGENIIPSITKSSEVISNVLPFIEGKIASSSMTVPIRYKNISTPAFEGIIRRIVQVSHGSSRHSSSQRHRQSELCHR